MLGNKGLLCRKIFFVLLLVVTLCWVPALQAGRPAWHRREVNWRMAGGGHIKAVNYPADKPPMTLNQHRRSQPKVRLKAITPPSKTALGKSATGMVSVAVIDSPPIDGFVPWVVVSITDESGGYWDIDAVPTTDVVGNYLTENPQSDYAIAIFDTGASSHIFSDDDTLKTGIYDAGLVTSLEVELMGATGTAITYTTNPLGIFIAGLDILESNGLLIDDSEMLGEYNVSVITGDPVESPNLPTAIGMPLGIYLSADFCNNRQFSATIDGNDFNSPYISFYSSDDPCAPTYSNHIDLQLRPSDAAAVQYFPCDLLGLCEGEPDGTPLYPSIIWGGLLSNQSLLFLPLVDLADGNDTLNDREKFMFDTGAQVTVISRTIASGLHLDTHYPDLIFEIQDVTGQITPEPGFYLDSLDIPADGQWLEYTNVPVVVLNIDSPEGGFLDGIIGMNLFTDLNFVVNGGGFTGPTLEFEPACSIVGDIVPELGDCIVDNLDLAELVSHWLETSISPNWNPLCDIAPLSNPDGKIDFLDFAVLAEHWLEDLEP